MPYPYYPTYMNPQNYLYPQQQQPMPTPQAQAQTPSAGLTWVQGEAGAKSYLVGAGQSVLLMDSENSCFYIKSTDNSGMPLPLRVFDYSERTQSQPNVPAQAHTGFDPKEYVTREEFNQWTMNFKASLLAAKKEVEKDAE